MSVCAYSDRDNPEAYTEAWADANRLVVKPFDYSCRQHKGVLLDQAPSGFYTPCLQCVADNAYRDRLNEAYLTILAERSLLP